MTADISNQEIEMIIIPPRTDLRDRVMKGGSADNASRKAIQAAEEAINDLSVEFDNWMNEAIDDLSDKIKIVKEQGMKSPSGNELHTIIHDLKGQASTLGYPTVAEICDTLCSLLEKAPDVNRISPRIIEVHVQAIKTIVQECSKNQDDAKANAISLSLRQMVMKILKEEFEHAK